MNMVNVAKMYAGPPSSILDRFLFELCRGRPSKAVTLLIKSQSTLNEKLAGFAILCNLIHIKDLRSRLLRIISELLKGDLINQINPDVLVEAMSLAHGYPEPLHKIQTWPASKDLEVLRVELQLYAFLEERDGGNPDHLIPIVDQSSSLSQKIFELTQQREYQMAYVAWSNVRPPNYSVFIFLMTLAFNDGQLEFVRSHAKTLRNIHPVFVMGQSLQFRIARSSRNYGTCALHLAKMIIWGIIVTNQATRMAKILESSILENNIV